jgi:glycosyltransferase involved in cell wall biosynthesis
MPQLSIVIPVYNAELSLVEVVRTLVTALSGQCSFEVLLVNDHSQDRSWDRILELQHEFPSLITGIDLARNFGEHNAVMAGYRLASGDFIANIDDDFQNPPGEILRLLDEIRNGYDAVYSYYDKKQHSFLRNLGSYLNDRIATIMLKKPKDLYLSSFRIVSASLRDEIVNYWGPYPYIDGLILRATARISTVKVDHSERLSGESNYTLVRLLRLWSYMFFNFSVLPLRISIFLGLLFSITGFCLALVVFVERIIDPELQIGWASLMTAVLLLSGVQLFMLGVLGEYIGRTFITTNSAPQYVIHEVMSKDDSQ